MILSPASAPARISVIVCAYNEGPRIGAVLEVACGHPLVSEVVVVDDGSRDDTAAVVRRFPGARLIPHEVNRGKSAAMTTGVVAARHEWVMLLDADLQGLRREDVAALAAPVLSGAAQVSMSLRRNSLAIFRAAGIDFVSGERVLARQLLLDVLTGGTSLPRFGVEIHTNRHIIARGLPLAVVDWPGVTQTRKVDKVGLWRGLRSECRMIADLMRTAYPAELLGQTPRLLALTERGARARGLARHRA